MDGAKTTTLLKSDALGRVTVTKEKREAMLDEFERSGLKGAQFARVAGIRYQTFAYWVQQRGHSRGEYRRKASAGTSRAASSVRLVEAVVATAPATPRVEPEPVAPAREPLEVLLPGGAKMLIAGAHQVTLAAKLIQALARSC